MPRAKSDDPLVVMNLRLPRSLFNRVRAKSVATGASMSDVFRSHVSFESVKETGRPKPRRREPKKLGSVSSVDPQLIRHLAQIGNNLNQLSHQVNAGALSGTGVQSIQLLVQLKSIEAQLHSLIKK